MNTCCLDRKKTFIHIALFLYWAALVIMQNIGEYTARNAVDTLLKLVLLLGLSVCYFVRKQTAGINAFKLFLLLLFVVCQLLTLFEEGNISLGIIVSYVFPSLFLFLSLVVGDKISIDRKQYVFFLNCVICVVAYSAVYALLFKFEQFMFAFAIPGAYGYELCSFFVSNHEYGLYLLSGIVSCVICLDFKESLSVRHKIVYWLALILFVPNLVLTYSRTSILAAVLFLAVYVIFRGKSRTKSLVLIAAVVFALIFAFSHTFRDFVLKIVLKNNNAAGRDQLYRLAIDYFGEGNLWQKLFGRGIEATRRYFVSNTTYGSVHNGYLQVLLYYGISGLLFLLGFLALRFASAVRLMKTDRFIGALNLGLCISCAVIMFTNTTMIFMSPIDCYFLTVFTIIVPKYHANSIEYTDQTSAADKTVIIKT